MDELGRLREELRAFAAERDWEQFHTPKNLAMALAGEVGELLAHFQWLTPEESAAVMSGPDADQVRAEVADVFGYLVRLADVLDVDLAPALRQKMQESAQRYTVEQSRGNARKIAR